MNAGKDIRGLSGNAPRFAAALAAALLAAAFCGPSYADALGQTHNPGARAAGLSNIAHGRPYSFSQRPNRAPSDADATSLTDGLPPVHPRHYDWFHDRENTVGWSSPYGIVTVTVDLGRVEPIAGAGFRTNAGLFAASGSPSWAHSVAVLVSDDGEAFRYAGDLVRMGKEEMPPAFRQSAPHWFWTDALEAKGRYVTFAAVPSGRFVFVDQVEVYRGPDALLNMEPPGEPVAKEELTAHPAENFLGDGNRLTRLGVYRRLRRDLETAGRLLAEAGMAEGRQAELAARLAGLREEVERSEWPEDWETFRAVVPFNGLHREIFKVHAEILAASGHAGITLWDSPPYAILPLFARPPADAGVETLRVRMMQNERRPVAFNLTNATGRSETARFRIAGLPGGDNPDWLRVHAVEYVDTAEGEAVASALVRLEPADGRYEVEVPAGMTRQVWMQADSKDLPAGEHSGEVRIECGAMAAAVPLRIGVAGLRMPDRLACSLGMWDDVHNANWYGLTQKNRQAAIDDINDHVVDSVWGHRGNMPGGGELNPGLFDADGNLTGRLSFAGWDAFLATWPGKSYYFVSAMAARSLWRTFPGSHLEPGTPQFYNAVSQWAAAWAEHNRQIGLRPGQVMIHWVDEPKPRKVPGQDLAEVFRTLYYLNKATKEGSGGDIAIYTNPSPQLAFRVEYGRRVIEESDLVQPARSHFMRLPAEEKEYFKGLTGKGVQFGLYMCYGPTRLYHAAYYRLQPWHLLEYNGNHSAFWAYSSLNSRGRRNWAYNWNEYVAVGGTNYAPAYIGEDSVTPSKHWEAARAGVLDFQYVTMLRERVAQMRQAGIAHPLLEEAAAMADTLAPSVNVRVNRQFARPAIIYGHGAANYEYARQDLDVCGPAEEARLQVLDMLEKLR